MKNKKLIGAIVGFLLLALGALQTYLDAPEAAPVTPPPVPASADAGTP
jgi:hypothetical protein